MSAQDVPSRASSVSEVNTASNTPQTIRTRGSTTENIVCAVPNGQTRVSTNKVPAIILPEEIPYARLILRRDRATHFYDIGRAIEKLHNNEQACDCAIVCGKKRFLAHRAVLAAHSNFFRKLLYDNGDKLPVDVPADGVPPQIMEDVLGYMYSGDLNINFTTAMDVKTTAKLLEMKDLSERTNDFVDTILSPENLISTLELAEKSGVEGLYSEAYRRLALNFYSQTKMTIFLLWDVDKVCLLLGNDNIILETEMHVFIAAMRWLNYKRAERKVHFKRLMDCVRWVYITTEEVMKCVDMERELIRSNDVRPVLIDATWYTTLKSYDVTWKDYPIPLPRIRALRDEDPEKVVERIRVSLATGTRHPSFDNIWVQHEPQKRGGRNLSQNVSSPGNSAGFRTPRSRNSKSQKGSRQESRDFLEDSTDLPPATTSSRYVASERDQNQRQPKAAPAKPRRATHAGASEKDNPPRGETSLLQVAKSKLKQLRPNPPAEKPRPQRGTR